jgi:hydrogenase/urease accessory protein HupE
MLFLAAFLTSGPGASAHPVAQGSIDLTMFPDHIELVARISPEEVFVTGLHDPATPATATTADLLQRHGAYVLRHLVVSLDGEPLPGSVVATPPSLDPKAPRALVAYEFSFARGARATAHDLLLREDLMNEIMYAVGNRWEASFFVRIALHGGTFDSGHLLTSRQPLLLDAQPAIKPAPNRWPLVAEYFQHGIWHILTGWDHLLFISALVLAVNSVWDLVKVIAAFTLAHTITLTLAVLGIVRLPEYIVEPMISASIIFVALQNMVRPESARGATRLAVAFFFGLFHGLGFAGGLLDAMHNLAGWNVGLAIAAFSIGVEVGHQAVVLPIFFVLQAARRLPAAPAFRAGMPQLALRYGSILIAVAGCYYLNEALHLPR